MADFYGPVFCLKRFKKTKDQCKTSNIEAVQVKIVIFLKLWRNSFIHSGSFYSAFSSPLLAYSAAPRLQH